jgi:flavodoxin
MSSSHLEQPAGNVLIVYDSVFGNTEKVAQAMGQALEPLGEVQVLRVSEVQSGQLTGVNVLIVGSPTRAFSPTPASKKLLEGIPDGGLEGVKVAAFDTRINVEEKGPAFLKFMVKLFGYAAKPLAKRLQRKGGQLVIDPEGFYVEDTEGPLAERELDRAAAWAKRAMRGG